jgi:hypothetical protein
MYLITFTLLIVGILGIYTQVFAIQTARLFASQTGIAQTMIAWHSAALSLADNIVNPSTGSGGGVIGAGGCSLSASYLGPGYCSPGLTITNSSGTAWATVTGGAPSYTINTSSYKTASGASYPHISPNYASSIYQWKSLAFQNGGYYVITYVDPPSATSPPPGYISTASGTQLGISQADLYQQLSQSGLSPMNYGYVNSANMLVTPSSVGGGAISYPVPATISPGSLAIISNASQCSGC